MTSPSAPRFGLLPLLLMVTLPLYLLDQLTKYLVQAHITSPIEVLPNFFTLVFVTNTGAAWGVMHDSNLFFIGLSVLALIVIGILAGKGSFAAPLPRTGFCLLVAGILGNLTDRLVYRHVIDFLSFDLHLPGASPWPSFNVADSCICVAVGCFVLSSFFELRAPTPAR